MTNPTFHGLSAGDQLGNLEYTVDDALMAEYRELVGCGGCYPNLLADDCRALLVQRCGSLDLTTVWRRLELLRPPIAGRRVQVGGWLREIEERHGFPLLRVAAFAVDEIGTEILRSEAAFVVCGCEDSQEPDVPQSGSPASVVQGFSDGMVGGGFNLGRLTLPDGGADRSTALLAGWLEGQLGRHYGDDFRWGGTLSLAYLAPAVPGGAVAGDAVVVGCDRDAGGAVKTRLVVSVFNRAGARIAVGEALITSPSPRLL
ncbi:MAG: hypothetical protein F4W95_12915 [Chloroflexi bacterium]|nr:hypothetical protein [Chloroflexota bacterium]MYD49370.1 hypothetical protein [Chloroflexota bacterium]